MATQIVIADSATIFRAAVRSLLERDGDFEVAEASDLDGLLVAVRELAPALALVDLDLPPRGGIEAIGAVTARYPTRCVLWSLEPDARVMLDALRVEASGFLPKRIEPTALARALRGATHGETALPRSLTSDLVHELQSLARRQRARERAATLSGREWDVLALVAGGYANRQIATSLFISEFTVKRHIHNILEKLDQRSRTGAAAIYLQAREQEQELDSASWAVSQ